MSSFCNGKTFSEITINDVLNHSEENIAVLDNERDLELVGYQMCSNDSDEFTKQCRGLVFKEEKLFLRGNAYADEIVHNEHGKIAETLKNLEEWTYFPAYEGALIRMFYTNDKWFVSTHRKLDAFRSKWSSRESFGAIFEKSIKQDTGLSLEEFKQKLDKTKQYMFLVRNQQDNRIVCLPPGEDETHVFHIGTWQNLMPSDDDVGVKKPQPFITFSSVVDLATTVNSLDPWHYQGIICFGPDNKQVKILNKDYVSLFKVRGNEASVKFRYLQLRKDKTMKSRLEKLYPEMAESFHEYEIILSDIAAKIYKAYVDRFVNKIFTIVPQEEFLVIRACHEKYKATHQPVTRMDVTDALNAQPPSNLNHMIKRQKLEI
jgi:hypothetical protein